MLEEAVAEQGVELYLTVEEAEALARAAVATQLKDRRQKALVDQALDQIAVVCRQVRRSAEAGDEQVGSADRPGGCGPREVASRRAHREVGRAAAGRAIGCLLMIPVSIVLSVVLTVVLNALLTSASIRAIAAREGRPPVRPDTGVACRSIR